MPESPVYPEIAYNTVHPRTGRRVFHPARINRRQGAQVGDRIVVATTLGDYSKKRRAQGGGYKIFVLADKPSTRIDLPEDAEIVFDQQVSVMGAIGSNGARGPGGYIDKSPLKVSRYAERYGFSRRLVEKYIVGEIKLAYFHPGQVATVLVC